ncbi:NAD(P)H-dependent oxidoreductase subunit E [Carboxylicivirga sp. M1479]|uniref:NAD(P)H-dependent oxidoreductase subunit E n=1 Tax=Carboxylicivirga sp. M1479 TaxID=2594476 RepID=UPI001177E789|nr:NAD(P)H-dependent oxidoreductase subunit E [Carboxylicivirga sp. M1479]TRX64303.1 (2Fe-2S) ferredoxin domain-containing protein [Carboxylicivirga sp. M1479]
METKHEIVICLGSSCFSRGNKDVLEIVKEFLNEHDLAAEVFFHGDLCGGKCENGPVLQIDDQTFSKVTVDNVYEVLNDYFEVEQEK